MDFLTAQKELGAQLGLDYTQTDTAVLLKRWLNLSYQDIVGDYTWSWLKSREAIAMATDYTTGTVDITAGSTTITFSTAPTASQANRYVQFSSANDWYKITDHTAASTTATISPAYTQTSALSDGTLTIRTFYYSLSSACEYVISVKEAINYRALKVITAQKFDEGAPFSTTTGTPTTIVLWGQDSSGYWQFTPYPWPDDVLLLEFRTIKKITELSETTDEPLFPPRFESPWLYGAKCYGYDFLDDDRAIDAFIKFESKIKKMRTRDTVGLNKMHVLQSIDSQPTARDIVQFPAEFGDIQ